MSLRLRDEDALAVDLLLDRANAAQGNGQAVVFGSTSSHTRVSNERIGAVEKVLKALDAMPSPDPAQDLVRRTIERIESSTGAPLQGETHAQIDHGRPVA